MNNTTKYAGVYTATKGTPGNPGASYLKLTSKTVSATVVNGVAVSGKLDTITMQAKSGFAFTQRPASFTGNWQYMNYGASSGRILVTLTRWDTGLNQRVTVGVANQVLTGMVMSWASFNINFAYSDGGYPDTCIISLRASGNAPTNNDYLWVDNLGFSGTVLGVASNNNSVTNLNVFPNPTSENITVEFNNSKSSNIKLQMLDLNGKLVKEINAGEINGNNKYLISTNGIIKGTYFINIINAHYFKI